MNNKEIFAHIDHTLLKPCATQADVDRLCEQALTYGAASVCVPPAYVEYIHKSHPKLNICTVIGFPLGYSTATVKAFECLDAILDGANEVDMVVNLTDVKNGNFGKIKAEIAVCKQACGEHILKVIVETCYLTEAEKIALCGCVSGGGADYIKTSTGFGPAGASLDDIALFRQHLPQNVKIKAAGGMRTKEDCIAFLEAGCDRIGASTVYSALFGESKMDS